MTTSPAYRLMCDLLIQVDGFGRIARRQWLIDAGLEQLEAHLPPDLPAINFAPALLDAAYQQSTDHSLRLMVTALQEVVAGHSDLLNQVNALLADPDLMKTVFPNGRVAWAEDRATSLAVAKAYFNNLPTDNVSPHVTPPDVPFSPKSHIPFVANPDFVGRETELMAIAEGIKRGQGVVVAGMGGVGKTQVAVEWVHRYGRYFAGGVFWLDFSNEGSIPLSIASAGAAYQYPAYAQMELATQVRWVREQWKAETPTLLIFDNCEDPKLADEYAPIGSGARVLVTSRDQTMAQTIRAGGIRQINIETLPRPDSINLLQRLRPDLRNEDANAIAEELGDLPLALHIAGSFLQQYRTTSYGDPATYPARLRQPDLLGQLGKQGHRLPDLPTKHERDVARTFLISIERLEADLHPDPALTRFLLLFIAQFAPGVAVPIAWLNQGLPDGTDELDAVDALVRLQAVGLIDTPQESMVRMHRLLIHAVTDMAQIKPHSAVVIRTEHIMSSVVPRYGDSTFVSQSERWLPHARHVVTRTLTRRDEQAGRLANIVGYQLTHLAFYDEAAYWYEKSVEIRRECVGARHADTATSLNNLAELYRVQGRYERALPLAEEALAIRRDVLGTHHADTAVSLGNLANIFEAQGNYDRALPLREEGLAIHRAVLTANHLYIATSLNNLANLYQAQGKYDDALPLYEEAVQISKATMGARHPDTALYLHNLATLHRVLGNLDYAFLLYEETLAIRREVLGTNHPDTAITLNNLAALFKSLKNYDNAFSLTREALTIRQEVLGVRHPSTATSLDNLAELYRALGNYEGGLPLCEEALAIRREVLGAHHPHTATSLNNLAGFYEEKKLYQEALSLYEEALSIFVECFGKDHPYTRTVMENMERCRAAMEAIDHGQ